MFQDFQSAVRTRLEDRSLLPLRDRYRSAFSPSSSYGRHFGPPASDARQAAVMVLLEPREDVWTIPLTVRPQHLPDHPGQISFPGGRLEHGETYQQAAEREFAEELGTTFPGSVLGELRPVYVFGSNYFVRPFVAICSNQLAYDPCEMEVERVVHFPVPSLNDDSKHGKQHFGTGWSARVFIHNQDRVWGATAVMLGELAAILKDMTFPEL